VLPGSGSCRARVNKEEQKISLVFASSSRILDEIEKKFHHRSRVKGKIRNMTAYGAFRGARGRHRRNDSRVRFELTRKINHPAEVLRKAMKVEAVVIDIDK